jgi:hypothetical protein
MNQRLVDDYCWMLVACRYTVNRNWESHGFTTRLTRHVSLRESWGQRLPAGWRPGDMGKVYLNLNELLFVGNTSNITIRLSDIRLCEVRDQAPDIRGRAAPGMQLIILHLWSGQTHAYAAAGTALGQLVEELASGNGPLVGMTIAFFEGPRRRASLVERLPDYAGQPLSGLGHYEVLYLQAFWSGELYESSDEIDALKVVTLSRPELSGRLELAREYELGVTKQLGAAHEEVGKRAGDLAFRAADRAFLEAASVNDSLSPYGPG